jgi:hypothetical protein
MDTVGLEKRLLKGRQTGHLDLSTLDCGPLPATLWRVNEETYGAPFWTLVPISKLSLPRVGPLARGAAGTPLAAEIANLAPDLEIVEAASAGLSTLGEGCAALDKLVRLDASGNAIREAPFFLSPQCRCERKKKKKKKKKKQKKKTVANVFQLRCFFRLHNQTVRGTMPSQPHTFSPLSINQSIKQQARGSRR